MDDRFDPYHIWLGIPPAEQPPNHYRLLGIQVGESNLEVIERAADGRASQLKASQVGKRSSLSQKLLNEIAAARVCLLNPEKKGAYDATLAKQSAAKASLTPSSVKKFSDDTPQFTVSGAKSLQPRVESPGRKKSGNTLVEGSKIVAGSIAGLFLAVLTLSYFTGIDPLGWSKNSKKAPENKVAAKIGSDAAQPSPSRVPPQPRPALAKEDKKTTSDQTQVKGNHPENASVSENEPSKFPHGASSLDPTINEPAKGVPERKPPVEVSPPVVPAPQEKGSDPSAPAQGTETSSEKTQAKPPESEKTPDSIRLKLFHAQEAYETEIQKICAQVDDHLNTRETAARKKGNKPLVDQILAERKAFEEKRTLPKALPVPITRRLDNALGTLKSAHQTAAKQYTTAKRDEESRHVEVSWHYHLAGKPTDGRFYWLHSRGQFHQLANGKWAESSNGKEAAYTFDEVVRKDDRVELHDPSRDCRVNLHNDGCWVQLPRKPWSKYYDGAWQRLPQTWTDGESPSTRIIRPTVDKIAKGMVFAGYFESWSTANAAAKVEKSQWRMTVSQAGDSKFSGEWIWENGASIQTVEGTCNEAGRMTVVFVKNLKGTDAAVDGGRWEGTIDPRGQLSGHYERPPGKREGRIIGELVQTK